jgi:hypothetical protein
MLKISVKQLVIWSRGFLMLIPLSLSCLNMPIAQAQDTTETNETTSETEIINQPVNQPAEDAIRPGMVLSLDGGEKLVTEAEQAIANQNYDLAIEKLQGARQIFNQLSTFYLQLSQNFSGIDGKITEESRNKAFETGQKRDETTYQLALVHRSQNKSELSVPLLLQVIRSQSPTSELGKKAYQQLYEIGFISTPFSQ